MPIPERDIIRISASDRIFDRRKVLAALLMPLAMTLMAISSVNVALPSMQIGLDASDAQMQWVLAGYALAFGVSLVPGGRMGDVLGRGTIFVVGITIFTLSSVWAGLAPDATSLNIARLVMGFGAGLNSPQVNGMIQQYYHGHERAKAFASLGAVLAGSVAAGPLLTGIIIEIFGPELGWRAAFLLNGIAGIAAVWLALLWLPFGTERARRAAKLHAKNAGASSETAAAPMTAASTDLDPIGMVLLTLAVLGIMMPFMLKTWWGWLLIPLSVLLLVAWVAWERRYAARGREPMVDLRLFQYRNFTVQTAIAGITFIGTTSVFAVLAFYLQGGLGASALDTSLVSLPEAVLSGVVAMWAGGYVMRHGRTLLVWSLAFFAASIILMIGTAWLIEIYNISFWWMIAPLALMSFGHGAMGPPNQTIAVIDIPADAGGVAGGVKQTAERIGNALGNAMITGVYFAFVVQSPVMALTLSYGLIALIVLVSLTISIVDLKRQGPRLIDPHAL